MLSIPSPQVVEIVNNLPQSGWKSATVWTSLLVALVALIGVLISNRATGQNMIRAEDVRARAALDAENVRAANTIAAENLRAEKMLEAEMLRHQNALIQRSQEWQHNAKAEAYSEIITNFEVFKNAVEKAFLAAHPMSSKGEPYVPYQPEVLKSSVAEANDTARLMVRILARARLVGTESVAVQVGKLGSETYQEMKMGVKKANEHPDKYKFEESYQAFQRLFDKGAGDLILLMRRDLLGEELGDPVTEESAKDESAPADLPESSVNAA